MAKERLLEKKRTRRRRKITFRRFVQYQKTKEGMDTDEASADWKERRQRQGDLRDKARRKVVTVTSDEFSDSVSVDKYDKGNATESGSMACMIIRGIK